MGKLFLHAGVFLAFTVLVYFACMWFVRLDARKAARRTQRR